MDHLNTYVDLILKAQERLPLNKEGLYIHHIVPRANGGTDVEENLILLTHKEHMTAHKLLANVGPDQWFAVELLGLSTLRHLPKWKRKRIAHRRAYLHRAAKASNPAQHPTP